MITSNARAEFTTKTTIIVALDRLQAGKAAVRLAGRVVLRRSNQRKLALINDTIAMRFRARSGARGLSWPCAGRQRRRTASTGVRKRVEAQLRISGFVQIRPVLWRRSSKALP
jgi:hypothetical protein